VCSPWVTRDERQMPGQLSQRGCPTAGSITLPLRGERMKVRGLSTFAPHLGPLPSTGSGYSGSCRVGRASHRRGLPFWWAVPTLHESGYDRAVIPTCRASPYMSKLPDREAWGTYQIPVPESSAFRVGVRRCPSRGWVRPGGLLGKAPRQGVVAATRRHSLRRDRRERKSNEKG